MRSDIVKHNFIGLLRTRIGSWTHNAAAIKYIIVVAVLLFSAFSAFKIGTFFLLIPVALTVVVIGLGIFLRTPALGLVMLVIGSLIIPSPFARWGYETTLNTTVLLVVGVGGVWVVDMFIRKRQIKFVKSRVLTPLFVFLVVVLISLIGGQLRYYYQVNSAPLVAQVVGVAIYILSAIAFLLPANLIDDIRWLERLCWIFLGIGAIYIFSRLNRETDDIVRPIFQYGSDACAFWIWMVAISSSQAFFNPKLVKKSRIILVIILVTTIYLSLIKFYSWKSGWLPALVSLAVIMFFGAPKLRIPGVILVLIAASLYFSDIGSSLTGEEDYSILTRWEAWRVVLEISKANPIIGLGPSNYYWYGPLIPILGYSINFSSHNNYIDIYAQMGIVGLLAFTWFMWRLGVLVFELLMKVPEGFPRAYAIGVIGAFVGTLVSGMLGDWFFPFVYNVGMVGFRSSGLGWFFMGGAVLLEKLYLQRKLSSDNQAL